MNPENRPQGNEQQRAQFGRSIIIIVAILVIGALFFSLTGGQVSEEVATLPDIVGAIEAGEVETLTVRG